MPRLTVRGRGSTGRRGLLTGLAVLVGGVLARTPIRPAQADDGDKISLGGVTQTSSPTVLVAELAQSDIAFRVLNPVSGNAVAVLLQGASIPIGPAAASAGGGLIARGGDGAGVGIGGVGIMPSGGKAKAGPAGTGLQAVGGDSEDGSGGNGAQLLGGDGLRDAPGSGLVGVGGASVQAPGGDGGSGVAAFGGNVATGHAGHGLLAQGGDAKSSDADGGIGLVAFGGRSRRRAGVGGFGVMGLGGGKDGFGATGVMGLGSSEVPGLHGRNAGTGPGLVGQSSSEGGLPPEETIAAVHAEVNPGVGTGASLESTDGVGAAITGRFGGLQAASLTAFGITGISQTSSGLQGVSSDGPACEARSSSGVGGHFETETTAAPALVAFNSTADGGQAGNGSGGLLVNGSLVVQNGLKSAAVQTSHGMSLLYCLEATVALFEDFGTARLVNGRARVEIDRLFLETIDPRTYHVLLTPRGETGGVYIATQDLDGFEIGARRAQPGTVLVDYRIVARRKGLPDAHRLATFRPPPRPSSPDPASLRPPARLPVPSVRSPARPPQPQRPADPPDSDAIMPGRSQ